MLPCTDADNIFGADIAGFVEPQDYSATGFEIARNHNGPIREQRPARWLMVRSFLRELST